MPTPADAIQPPTPLARRFVRVLVGFGVGVAVGCLPYLGYGPKIPGFRALVSLLPLQLQDDLLPFSGATMGLAAIVLQLYAEHKIPRATLRRHFRKALIAFGIGLVAYLGLYSEFIVRMRRGDHYVSVMIGTERLDASRGCECPPRVNDRLCIRELSFAEEAIESCWGSRPLRRIGLLFRLAYLLVTGAFAALAALVVYQEQSQRRGKPAEAKKPKGFLGRLAALLREILDLVRPGRKVSPPEEPAEEEPPEKEPSP
ncbi:MAG: hypothetical protein ACRD2T_16400 [Thermoanaerobaculia bacterium]